MSHPTIAAVCVAIALSSLTLVDARAQTVRPATPQEKLPVAEPSSRLVERYTGLAGSPGNATSLVEGMESGSSVTLTPVGIQPLGTGPVTFTPATRLPRGEVNIALSLAKAELSKAGITNPTPAQLQSALNGGTITKKDGSTVTLKGVLAARQSGMGWGQIAQSMGVKLGTVMRASKSTHSNEKEHRGAQEHKHSSHHTDHAAGRGKGEASHASHTPQTAQAGSHHESHSSSHSSGGNGGNGGAGHASGGGGGGGKK